MMLLCLPGTAIQNDVNRTAGTNNNDEPVPDGSVQLNRLGGFLLPK